MIEIAALDVRFGREMAKRISEDIQRAYDDFGQGAWINRTDVAASGAAAVALHAKIAAMKIALQHVEQTDKALTGRAPKKETRAHG